MRYTHTVQPFPTLGAWSVIDFRLYGANAFALFQYQYRERIAFAVSAAILFTCLREKPTMVRGVFGRITSSVLN